MHVSLLFLPRCPLCIQVVMPAMVVGSCRRSGWRCPVLSGGVSRFSRRSPDTRSSVSLHFFLLITPYEWRLNFWVGFFFRLLLLLLLHFSLSCGGFLCDSSSSSERYEAISQSVSRRLSSRGMRGMHACTRGVHFFLGWRGSGGGACMSVRKLCCCLQGWVWSLCPSLSAWFDLCTST